MRIEAWPEAQPRMNFTMLWWFWGFLPKPRANAALSNLHDNLAHGWPTLMESLQQNARATVMTLANDTRLWIAAERLQVFQLLFPQAPILP